MITSQTISNAPNITGAEIFFAFCVFWIILFICLGIQNIFFKKGGSNE